MSITTYLEQILSARYGKDVRQSIHDAIEEGYNIAVQAQGTAETSQESAEAYAAAALASEQAAQNYMNQAEQYKNEAFSGTPTGYADLVAKVNSIYKETASSFGVVGTVEGLALAHTIYGMSEQDGTPTPSAPVDIDSAVANFKCVGKNLVYIPFYETTKTASGITFTDNGDGSLTIDGTAEAAVRFYFHNGNSSITKNNVSYTLSNGLGRAITGLNVVVAFWVDSTYTGTAYGTTSGTDGKITFTVPSSLNYNRDDCYVSIASGTTINNLTIYPMLTLADVDQTYEPYQSKTITTDLTLRAIEVTSSDNYNLVKDGKYYIADTLDWDEDSGYSITRRVKQITINSGDVTTTSNPRYGVVLRTAFDPNEFSVRQSVKNNLLLSAFVSATYENFISESGNGLAFFDGTNLRLRHDSMASTADWSTYLQSNPVKVIGVLVTPTSETVTSAQAQALLGLKTYDEATSIDATGDVAPSIDLEYSKDRNTALALIGHNMAHINALKIADLSV